MSIEVVTIRDCTLYLGDCLEVLPTLEDVDSVITSPPYNCGKNYGQCNDDLSIEAYSAFLTESVFSIKSRVFVVNVGQFIGSRSERVLFRDVVIDAAGWLPLVDEVVWDKGPANGSAWGNYPNSPRIRAQHESIFVFGEAKMPTGNGLDWSEWSRFTTSIWRISPNVNLSIHPAMMPLQVAVRCVSLWSDVNGTVLDPFMGTGTTGAACVARNRRFIGIEREPKYFDIACKRVEKAYKDRALLDIAEQQTETQPQLFIEEVCSEVSH